MKFLFIQAWKDLRGQPRFVFLLLLNLGLGLSGLVAIESFRNSLESGLEANAQSTLGADLAISVRRPWRDDENKILDRFLGPHTSAAVELFSMAGNGGISRLANLKAVESQYPLRGEIELRSQGKLGLGAASSLKEKSVWIDSDLAEQLQVTVGDKIKLGGKDFIVGDLVSFNPTQSFRGFASSGTIFLSLEDLKESGLLRDESVATYIKFYRFSADQPQYDIASLEKSLSQDVRVTTPQNASEDAGRLLSIISDFLGLAALVGLFLSALGVAYLFRTWNNKRIPGFALQQVLGLSRQKSIAIFAIQAALVALFAVPLTLAFSFLELYLLKTMTESFSPVGLNAKLHWSTLIQTLFLSTVFTLLLALPDLVALKKLPLIRLMQRPTPAIKAPIVSFIPGILLLVGLSVYQANSWRNAFYFLLALSVALVLIFCSGKIFLLLAEKLAQKVSIFSLRQALLLLARGNTSTMAAYLALALGVLLLNLLPQLRSAINQELTIPGKTPSLFLFDIQDEQLESLKDTAQALGTPLDDISPMVRARLLKVNDNSFEKSQESGSFQTREEENEARFRNRGFNLSYRRTLGSAEKLMSGRAFSLEPQNPGEISLEYRFAVRLGLKIGDRLTFDVQGVPVEGVVVNLRQVNWLAFLPNFFVLFQDGILNDAPKIHLASIKTRSSSLKKALQEKIALRYPNVSIIDIRLAVERVLVLVDKIRWALLLMAVIALISGFTVIFSITQIQNEMRRGQLNLMRVIGAPLSELRKMMASEFGLLASLAVVLGIALSTGIAWALAYFVFEASYFPNWTSLLLSGLLTLLIAMVVAMLGLGRIWRANPAEMLRE